VKLDGLKHPKTKELAYKLGIPLPHAIGLLELLLKWSNAVIAGECGWESNPDDFVDALLYAGFLDESETYRLLVHDWADHCPNYVHAKLKKTGRTIIRGDLSADLRSDIRGRYKRSEAKPCDKGADAPPKNSEKSIPPTVEQVAEYVRDKGYSIDAEQFVAHYTARGWKLNGGQRMKCWKSACTTWQKNAHRFGASKPQAEVEL